MAGGAGRGMGAADDSVSCVDRQATLTRFHVGSGGGREPAIRAVHAAPTRFKRLVHLLRTEGDTPARQSAAVGIGVFIGCLPLYGLHLPLCLAACHLGRLNRIKMYLAANISNPAFAPLLLFLSVQLGAVVRTGRPYELSLAALSEAGPWRFGQDLLVGSVIVGTLLGMAGAAVAWAIARVSERTDALFEAAADRYLPASITAWEFARNKLKADPAYGWIMMSVALPREGRLVDVGCGQGLLLAALATAHRWQHESRWPPHWPVPSRYELTGIELRPRAAALARGALGTDATIVHGDLRAVAFEPADVIVMMDVLHLLPASAQETLLARAARALRPGGVLLVREADRGAGWRFRAVQIGNRITALVRRNWRQRFAFRSEAEWRALLASLGLDVERVPLARGPVFGNVLLIARLDRSMQDQHVAPGLQSRRPRDTCGAELQSRRSRGTCGAGTSVPAGASSADAASCARQYG
jgi:SAM-dependent methyltransferase